MSRFSDTLRLKSYWPSIPFETMIFRNPFPDSCSFASDKAGIDLAGVHPLEIEIGNAFLSASRRVEFFSGRRCAHAAMKAAGYPALPILRHRDRSPLWPLNILGSISHGASLAAAIIRNPHQPMIGLGLDIEDLSRDVRSDITRHTLTPAERDRWASGSGQLSREARIIFSIKEAIYKCYFPIARVPLGFQDAEITEITDSDFRAHLLKNPFKDTVPLPINLEGSLQFYENAVCSALKAETNRHSP